MTHSITELLLRIDGRLVRVLLDDVRGADGAVPTLICRAARFAEVVPHVISASTDDDPSTGKGWPGMPRLLRESPDEDDDPLPFKLDVSALPSGLVPFTLEDFAKRLLDLVGSGATEAAIDLQHARAWGCEL